MIMFEPPVFRDLLAIAIMSQAITEDTTPADMAAITQMAYALANAALSERTELGYS